MAKRNFTPTPPGRARFFQPKPTPVVMAMWEYLGRLTVPMQPTAGINWMAYVRSGGPARYIGKRNG
jgi:hypothetical protein